MIGQVVNNYEIQSLLGEGGMGSVYLAVHPFMGRKAAIKVLRSDFASDKSQVERFMNEARAANAIRHPNIIDIIDVGRLSNGLPYLMMEYLDGENLAERIHRLGLLPTNVALEIGIQTASALSAAHARHVTHRDLKPDNLVLIKDPTRPGGEQVKVLDFGIAKLRGELSGVSAKTQTGSVMGTPPYMSPEQCRGLTDEIDHRTDIYALGIILYESLCGEPPFVSPAWGEVVLGHMTLPPVPPRTKNPAIPDVVEAVILKALAKKREDRYASMVDMEAALQSARARAGAMPVLTPVAKTIAIGSASPPMVFSPVSASAVPTAAAAAPARSASVMPASPSGTAVARPVTPSRPPTSAPEPASSSTTFRGATGEMGRATAAGLEAELAEAGINPRRGSRVGIAAGVIGLVAVGIVGVLAGGRVLSGGRKPVPVPAPGPESPVPVPPGGRQTPPSPPVQVPAEPPATVVLRLSSDPPGAKVTNARGQVLGVTPLQWTQDRAKGELDLRFEKEGYLATGLSIPLPLYKDLDTTIRLERRGGGAKGARENDRPKHVRTPEGGASPVEHRPPRGEDRDEPARARDTEPPPNRPAPRPDDERPLKL